MNVINAMREYIMRVLRVSSGLKIILLDDDTTKTVSLVYSQSEMLEEEIFLFNKIEDETRPVMAHLKAVCFLRPTENNIRLLKNELKNPKYGEYYLFFSNVLQKKYLEYLAEADQYEVIMQIQEYYGDYFAINPDTWHLNLPIETCVSTKLSSWTETQSRIEEGLLSCLLSLRVLPAIRAQKSSAMAMTVAQGISDEITNNAPLFEKLKPSSPSDVPPILLILDRRDDPVTPLLSQWTYQSMIHELIGINNEMVTLPENSTVDPGSTVLLSPLRDPFYKEFMYDDFGNLGIAVKKLVDEFQSRNKINKEIKTIDDMKKFVTEYPQFKAESSNVRKHVAIMESLQRIITKRKLFDISELEQHLACNEDYSYAVKKLDEVFNLPETDPNDLLRILILFQLRYEFNRDAGNTINKYMAILKSRSVSEDDLSVVSTALKYGGTSCRSEHNNLFENKDIRDTLRSMVKTDIFTVSNVFTQHKPLIHQLVNSILSANLSEESYPYFGGSLQKAKPTKVILFILGGITFEEAFAVQELNKSKQPAKVVLGGTQILSSSRFLQLLKDASKDKLW